MAKGRRIGVLVAQNSQFMGDQWMVGNVNFHNPNLTALSFLSNEWEYEQRDT
jgi:hypothetical protein